MPSPAKKGDLIKGQSSLAGFFAGGRLTLAQRCASTASPTDKEETSPSKTAAKRKTASSKNKLVTPTKPKYDGPPVEQVNEKVSGGGSVGVPCTADRLLCILTHKTVLVVSDQRFRLQAKSNGTFAEQTHLHGVRMLSRVGAAALQKILTPVCPANQAAAARTRSQTCRRQSTSQAPRRVAKR